MKMRMNKKGVEHLFNNIMFLILMAIFFSVMFIAVSRYGSQATVVEQAYAKKIALSIDKAKPGTIMKIDISELYDVSTKNKYKGTVVSVDNVNKNVIVHVVNGNGYSYGFFNGANIVWDLKKDSGYEELYLEVVG